MALDIPASLILFKRFDVSPTRSQPTVFQLECKNTSTPLPLASDRLLNTLNPLTPGYAKLRPVERTGNYYHLPLSVIGEKLWLFFCLLSYGIRLESKSSIP